MGGNRVLIIGGGIAGLCAGVYLRKHGFETEILEMHSIAGGLATAWKREGYTFENCIHWLLGSKEGEELNAVWKEIFDPGRLEFVNDEIYQVIEDAGRSLVVYRDVDRMEQEFLAKAPEDAAAIREMAGLVRSLTSFRFPGGDSFIARVLSVARAVPHLLRLRKYGKFTLAQYAASLKNPLLRRFFTSGVTEMSFLGLALALAWMSKGNAGYPVGGSLRLIGLIQDNYWDLGGTIRFGARVERISVRNGRAAGVALESGEAVEADIVVSAADGHATIFQMLEGKYVGKEIADAYREFRPFPSYVQVSLGIGADLKGEPGYLGIALGTEIALDPETRLDFLAFRIFNFDPTFAPPGKTAVVCFMSTYNDGYWIDLRQGDHEKYDLEKERIAKDVIAVFEERFPAARGRIEVVDVATPATVVRYTGNWRGSMEGWLVTPATGMRRLPYTLPGLNGFYMVGQWVSPGGGLPSGVMTARDVSRMICRKNRVRWNPA